MTQRGARTDFQRYLRTRGVEVLEFDFLTPEAVAEYCYERGFLQLLWECGGTLSAPVIAAGVIHKVAAFVAPKIIGGDRAPTPVGDLGFVEMTQAVQLVDTRWQATGQDVMCTGYLASSSGGLEYIDERLERAQNSPSSAGAGEQAAVKASTSAPEPTSPASSAAKIPRKSAGIWARGAGTAEFYKAFDEYGALSNFSPHPIVMPDLTAGAEPGPPMDGVPTREWLCVESFYQAAKFSGAGMGEAARAIVREVAAAQSPEEAARIGRRSQRAHPDLVRSDWESIKVEVMMAALRAKIARHAGPRDLLLQTARAKQPGARPLALVEASPHDFFWGRGDGTGRNQLGLLLMQIREELVGAERVPVGAGAGSRRGSSADDVGEW